MGIFKKKQSSSAQDAQRFGSRLIEVLSGKKIKGAPSESHWELIFGFIFFFGGIYFLVSFLLY